MLQLRVALLSLVLAPACSQSMLATAERQPLHVDDEEDAGPPEPYESTLTSFVAQQAPSGPCASEREQVDGKLVPPEQELEEILGDNALLFVVLMTPELSAAEFPTDLGTRNVPDLADTERGHAITKSQACALFEVEERGGRYLSSLWFTNGFAATLTAPAAKALSERKDVAIVELAASYTNLP